METIPQYTPTKFRENVYQILNQLSETGPVQIGSNQANQAVLIPLSEYQRLVPNQKPKHINVDMMQNEDESR